MSSRPRQQATRKWVTLISLNCIARKERPRWPGHRAIHHLSAVRFMFIRARGWGRGRSACVSDDPEPGARRRTFVLSCHVVFYRKERVGGATRGKLCANEGKSDLLAACWDVLMVRQEGPNWERSIPRFLSTSSAMCIKPTCSQVGGSDFQSGRGNRRRGDEQVGKYEVPISCHGNGSQPEPAVYNQTPSRFHAEGMLGAKTNPQGRVVVAITIRKLKLAERGVSWKVHQGNCRAAPSQTGPKRRNAGSRTWVPGPGSTLSPRAPT